MVNTLGLYDEAHLSAVRRGGPAGKTPNGTCGDKKMFQKAIRATLTCPVLVLRADEQFRLSIHYSSAEVSSF
jgi:hypothetical protein